MEKLELPQGLQELAERAAQEGMDPHQLWDYLRYNDQDRHVYVDSLRFTDFYPVTSVPLLSAEFCDYILERADKLIYEPNPHEEQDYQIPEAVLAVKDPELHQMLYDCLPGLNVWTLLKYQRGLTGISSIQLARYTPEETAGGNWHHDIDSDITFVVSLNPECYEGGGTEFRTSAAKAEFLPPLPKGYAVMFPGKLLMHRGVPVTKGRRDLLVFWLKV